MYLFTEPPTRHHRFERRQKLEDQIKNALEEWSDQNRTDINNFILLFQPSLSRYRGIYWNIFTETRQFQFGLIRKTGGSFFPTQPSPKLLAFSRKEWYIFYLSKVTKTDQNKDINPIFSIG